MVVQMLKSKPSVHSPMRLWKSNDSSLSRVEHIIRKVKGVYQPTKRRKRGRILDIDYLWKKVFSFLYYDECPLLPLSLLLQFKSMVILCFNSFLIFSEVLTLPFNNFFYCNHVLH